MAQGDLEETPVVAELGPETQDLEDQSSEQSLPSSPKAGESPPCLALALSFQKVWLWEWPSLLSTAQGQAPGLSSLVLPSIVPGSPHHLSLRLREVR